MISIRGESWTSSLIGRHLNEIWKIGKENMIVVDNYLFLFFFD